MTINNVGYKFVHGENFRICRPNGSGDYLLLFLRTGGAFTLGGAQLRVQPQSFLLYRKGTPQFYAANGEQFINDWLHFDFSEEEAAEAEAMGIPFDQPVACGDITFFSETVKRMYQEKYSANSYKDTALELYFRLLMVKLAQRLNPPVVQIRYPHYERLAALRTQIYNKPAFGWSAENMAKRVSLSVSYFEHLYKRVFGVGAMMDVINARVERAQYLLSSTNGTVSRVAEECGYKNDVHFMRQFKNRVGVTPSVYRSSFF